MQYSATDRIFYRQVNTTISANYSKHGVDPTADFSDKIILRVQLKEANKFK